MFLERNITKVLYLCMIQHLMIQLLPNKLLKEEFIENKIVILIAQVCEIRNK